MPNIDPLDRLLDTIHERNMRDADALRVLGIQAFADNPALITVKAPADMFYLLRKEDVAPFLFGSGVDMWHSTTWLAADGRGQLSADIAMSQRADRLQPRHVELGQTVWDQFTMLRRPIVDAGVEFHAFRARGLAEFMDFARSIAQRTPVFQELVAHQAAQAMSAALVPHRHAVFKMAPDARNGRPGARP